MALHECWKSCSALVIRLIIGRGCGQGPQHFIA